MTKKSLKLRNTEGAFSMSNPGRKIGLNNVYWPNSHIRIPDRPAFMYLV